MSPSQIEQLAWFGVRVKSRSEFRAHEDLSLRGYETLLPTYTVRRRWSDRIKSLQVPLFSGYVFCRFALAEQLRILNANGVANIVGFGNRPAAIEDHEIQSIQTLLCSKVACTPWPYLQAGRRVSIDRGPLAGVEGVVLRAEDGRSRVVVSVNMLFRSVAAEVEREWIGSVR
jgi:transcription antitermination factor NusG